MALNLFSKRNKATPVPVKVEKRTMPARVAAPICNRRCDRCSYTDNCFSRR